MKSKFNYNKLMDYIGAITLATFCLFAQYSLKIFSVGIVALLFYSVLRFFTTLKINYNKPVAAFIIFCIIHQAVIYIITDTFARNINTYFFMLFSAFLIFMSGMIDKEIFIRFYKFFVLLFSLFVVYQFFQITVLRMPVSAIKILPVAPEDRHYWSAGKFRPEGLFAEPQAYCSYVIPLLIYTIYHNQFKWSLYITLTILFSGSSQGIIVSLVVWVYYYLIENKSNKKKMWFIVLGGITLLLIIISGRFDSAIEKIISIDIFGYDIRLTKGFMIWFKMPLADKLNGIGVGNLKDYLINGGFDFPWMRLTKKELFEYVTSTSGVLIYYGILGFVFYLKMFWSNRNTCREALLLLLIIFVISFSQTILFNSAFIFYWSVFLIYKSDSEKNITYPSPLKRYKILKRHMLR